MADESKIQLTTDLLLQGVRTLFQQTEVFSNAGLSGASQCLLAAAASVGDFRSQREGYDVNRLANDLKGAPSDASKSLVDLLHG